MEQLGHFEQTCKLKLSSTFRQLCLILSFFLLFKQFLFSFYTILIIFGANIANMFYVNSDITLLGLMKSNYVVGIYSVSSKVYQIVKTLISALLIVTVPRLAMLFGNNKIEAYSLKVN